MAADEHAFDEEPIPGAMPERWETAIEDAAQVIALGLDRAQDLADLINDFVRNHPTTSKLILAGAGGMLVGSFIAGRMRPRQPFPAELAARLAEEARASVQATVSEMSGRLPSHRAILGRLPRIDREAMAERMPHIDREAMAERLRRIDRDAMASRMPRVDRDALAGRLPHVNGSLFQRRPGSSGVDLSQARYAAQLLPVALTLLRNPLVRQLLFRQAMRAARRS